MSNNSALERRHATPDEVADKLAFMQVLGQFRLVRIDEFTIGVVDPNDLVEGEEARLLASLDLRQERGLDELFMTLVGPAMFYAAEDRSFLVGDIPSLAE